MPTRRYSAKKLPGRSFGNTCQRLRNIPAFGLPIPLLGTYFKEIILNMHKNLSMRLFTGVNRIEKLQTKYSIVRNRFNK